MLQLIVFIVFVSSLLGMLFILFRKIPALVQLPRDQQKNFKDLEGVKSIKGKIGDAYTDFFEKQVILHKLLSKLKVMVLKIERKIDTSLHGIRKKTQEVEKKTRRKGNSGNTTVV